MPRHPRRLTAAAAAAAALTVPACTSDEVDRAAAKATSAAASAARSVHSRAACAAVRTDLAALGSLAGSLAADPERRAELAPQVGAAVDRLTRHTAATRDEWHELLEVADNLRQAVQRPSETAVRLTAGALLVVVRFDQATCAVANR